MGTAALWTDVLECLDDNPGRPEERPSGRGRVPWCAVGVLPLLLWWAALEGDSRILWLWHHGGNGDGVVGAGGDAY